MACRVFWDVVETGYSDLPGGSGLLGLSLGGYAWCPVFCVSYFLSISPSCPPQSKKFPYYIFTPLWYHHVLSVKSMSQATVKWIVWNLKLWARILLSYFKLWMSEFLLLLWKGSPTPYIKNVFKYEGLVTILAYILILIKLYKVKTFYKTPHSEILKGQSDSYSLCIHLLI